MNALGLFEKALARRKLVFVVGSGISFGTPAQLPKAPELLKNAVQAHLAALKPPEQRLLSRVTRRLSPEAYYQEVGLYVGHEGLAHLAPLDSAEVPNFDHLAICKLSDEAGTPILTVNFDNLLEHAARRLGGCRNPVAPPAEFSLRNAHQEVWRVHGRFGSKETLLSTLGATLNRVVRPSQPLLRALEQLLRAGRQLCLIGYSGGDLDFLPWLRTILDKRSEPPLWVDPFPSLRVIQRAQLIGAVLYRGTLEELLEAAHAADLLTSLIALVPASAPKVSDGCAPSLPRTQALLTAARCLHRVGERLSAETLLKTLLAEEHDLSIRDQAHAHVLLALVQDSLSDYDASLASAKKAHQRAAQIWQSERTASSAAVYVAAMAQRAMAAKMRLGPTLGPAYGALAHQCHGSRFVPVILQYLRYEKRMSKALRQVSESASSTDPYWLSWARNRHLDHRLVAWTLLIRAARAAPWLGSYAVRRLSLELDDLRTRALSEGDAELIAHIEKQAVEAGVHSAETDLPLAAMSYELIADNENRALLHRNRGHEHLQNGERLEAQREFCRCLRLAWPTRNAATTLKALAGLYAAGIPIPPHLIHKASQRLTGHGYRTFLRRFQKTLAGPIRKDTKTSERE